MNIDVQITGISPEEHADLVKYDVAESCVAVQVATMQITPVQGAPGMLAALFPMPTALFAGGTVERATRVLPWGKAKMALYARLVIDRRGLQADLALPPTTSGKDYPPARLTSEAARAVVELLRTVDDVAELWPGGLSEDAAQDLALLRDNYPISLDETASAPQIDVSRFLPE